MLHLNRIEDVPRSIRVRDVTIKTNEDPQVQLERVMHGFERNRPKDTLITSPYVQEQFQKFYDTIAGILTGRLDLDPYLPWRKGGNAGMPPTDREILVQDSYLYYYMDDYVKARMNYQLRLVPEISSYMINETEYSGNWLLIVDVFPADPYVLPIVKRDGKLIRHRVERRPEIPCENLEHGAIYLDVHGQEWLVIRNTEIHVDNTVVFHGQDGKPNNRQRVSTFTSLADVLYIKMNRTGHILLERNMGNIRCTAHLLAMFAQRIGNPYTDAVRCITGIKPPKLVGKHATLPMLHDTANYDMSFMCEYDTHNGRTIEHEYTFTYEEEEDCDATK